jgi:hypothetical protein
MIKGQTLECRTNFEKVCCKEGDEFQALKSSNRELCVKMNFHSFCDKTYLVKVENKPHPYDCISFVC